MAESLTPEALQALDGVLSPETAAMMQPDAVASVDPSLQPATPAAPAPVAAPQDPGILANVLQGGANLVSNQMYNQPAPAGTGANAVSSIQNALQNQMYGNQRVQSVAPDSTVEAPIEPPPAVTQQAQNIAGREVAAARAVSNAIAQDTHQVRQQHQIAQDVAIQRVQESNERGVRTLGEIMNSGDFGDKLGAALAVLAGGLSQGLLRSNSNPAVDAINNAVEQEAKKRKMSFDEKLELQRATIAEAELRLKQQDAASNDPIKKQTLQKLIAETNELKAKTDTANLGREKQKALAEMLKGNGKLTNVELLSKEQQERAVRLQDGTYQLAKNKNAADELDKFKAGVQPAIDGIARIKALAKDFNRVTDLNKRAQIQTEIKSLAGSLRLPFLGPGQMTEQEYQRLLDTIGDPSKLASIESLQKTKLDVVGKKLKIDLAGRYKDAGIDLPASREDQLKAKLIERGLSEEQAEKAVEKLKAQ